MNISEDYEIIAVIAVGKMGNKDELEEEFKNEEFPNTRRPIVESAWRLTHFIE